jgi:HEAT repeat protein
VDAVEELIQIIDCESDLFLAEEAVVALSKIGQAKALNALLRAARHKSFLVRARSIEALVVARGKWKRAAVDLADHDPSAMVRESARIDRE